LTITSAFLTPDDAVIFENIPARTCSMSRTIARHQTDRHGGKEKFGFDTRQGGELDSLGDIMMRAVPTPESAVAIAEPATQLALVIGSRAGRRLARTLIPELAIARP